MDDNLMNEQTSLSAITHSYSGKELKDYPHLLTYLLQVKHACAWANSQIGLISIADYEKIAIACHSLMNHHDVFCADVLQGGGGIAVHMNINEVLCEQLGHTESWLSKVNASQSTSDVCSTALSLALTKSIQECKHVCLDFLATLQQLAVEYAHVETIGRTCLRDASHIKQGERFSGFAQLLSRQCDALNTLSNFAYSNLGA